MGEIEPVELPEAALIIGSNWPQHDETAYAREALAQRSCAHTAAASGDETHAAATYTRPGFRGQAGNELTTLLFDRHQAHTDDEIRHHNVASWLDLASTSIRAAKSAMNTATTDYHRDYTDSERRAAEETWNQHQLATVKSALVQHAQARVSQVRAAFDDTHAVIAAGIAAGSPPAVPEAMAVYHST